MLSVDFARALASFRRWLVPERRTTEERREIHASEPTDGSERNGRHDGRHENSDGHDGPSNDYHGLDKFLLPGLCIE